MCRASQVTAPAPTLAHAAPPPPPHAPNPSGHHLRPAGSWCGCRARTRTAGSTAPRSRACRWGAWAGRHSLGPNTVAYIHVYTLHIYIRWGGKRWGWKGCGTTSARLQVGGVGGAHAGVGVEQGGGEGWGGRGSAPRSRACRWVGWAGRRSLGPNTVSYIHVYTRIPYTRFASTVFTWRI